MRLDACSGGGGVVTGAFDHIGVECSLRQEGDRASLFGKPGGFFLKDTHKLFADNLAFLLRVDYIHQFCQETLMSINDDQRDVQVAAECLDNLLTLTGTQAAGIDKNTGELVANSTMNKQCRHGRIDTTRE